MTWQEAWDKLNADGTLVERPGQKLLAEWIFYVTTTGGTLLAEAPVGVGKSFAYCIPLIYRVRQKQRGVISTETTALQDQLIDKDLPKLKELFGDFKFRSLKGRSWYYCSNRAPKDHGIAVRLNSKFAALGDGERRDVERVLGWRVSDDDWEVLSGESDFCAQSKCTPDKCFSSRARQLALDADIVVTNHALLRTHAEMVEDGNDGLLGDVDHLVIDEAHTLENVLIDGWGEDATPYDRFKAWKGIWDASSEAIHVSVPVTQIEEAERLSKMAIESIVDFFYILAQRDLGHVPEDYEWRRQNFSVKEIYLSGTVDDRTRLALEEYELLGPGRFKAAADILRDVAKVFKDELEARERGSKKIRVGMNAAKRLSRMFEFMHDAMSTRDGVVTRFGVPYAVLADGYKSWKGDPDVHLRCVPLDVSQRAAETLWKPVKSVTLVSGTLRDETDGSFRYAIESLGLPSDAHAIRVGSTFDYATNQLVYVTPGTYDEVDVPGAKYSMDELVRVVEASRGRALILFTAKAELEYAADYLRALRQDGAFPHQIFVQERGVQKQDLVRGFVDDVDSVLLATKSFFTGVDFPGETCSIVVLAKFPLPQYNALCRAQVSHWRKKGFPRWYEREAMHVFKQANGRLIRNEKDRGVIAIIDKRVADPKERVSQLTGLEISATGCAITNELGEVQKWLSTK
jgi:Rad3-related DNA helicase